MIARDVLVKIAGRIDANANDAFGTPITAANIHSATGKFTPEQRLDYYNQSRISLISALRSLPQEEFLHRCNGFVVRETIVFTTSGGIATAPKPPGFIMLVNNDAGIFKRTTTPAIPFRLREVKFIPALLSQTNPEFVQDAQTIFIFMIGNSFYHFGTFIQAGSYDIHYVKYIDLTMPDITGLLEEKFDESDIPILIDLAELAANGAAQMELVATAKMKLGIK